MISENQLIVVSSTFVIGCFSLAIILSGHNNPSNIPSNIKEKYKTNYATLFDEIEIINQKFMQDNIQHKISQQLINPQTQILAIKNLVRHELKSFISQVHNKNTAEIFTPQEQEEAYQASYNKIMDAISIGKWRSEDSHEIMQYKNKITPKKRIELLELYHDALSKNNLEQEPNVLPPPF